MSTYHEPNIRGEGKAVRVVFEYLPRSQLKKKVWGRVASLLPISQPNYGYFIKDDVTVILHLRISTELQINKLTIFPQSAR
jgi:hypothetical protein